MPAILAAVTSIDASSVTPNAREERLLHAYRTALEELEAALNDALLITHGARFGHDKSMLGSCFGRLFVAVSDYGSHLERRTKKAEQVMRKALASSGLSDDQRRTIMTTMHGTRGPQRDPHLLSEIERSMIDQYRHMDSEARAMIRTLFARLAATSTKGDA